MIMAVIDTHALIWYLYNNPRLSLTVRTFLETEAHNGEQIAMSSISMVEIAYLIEKGRVAVETFSMIATELSNQASLFVETPVDLKIARALSRVHVEQAPDMPDRIIAATDVHF